MSKSKVTLSIPKSAIDKILQDPEKFFKYLKSGGFDLEEIILGGYKLKDEKGYFSITKIK